MTTGEAQVFIPPDTQSLWSIIGLAIALALIGIGVIVPPLLSLNIPLLILRAFIMKYFELKNQRVKLKKFECPGCGAPNSEAEHNESLPFDTQCRHCGVPLFVGMGEVIS